MLLFLCALNVSVDLPFYTQDFWEYLRILIFEWASKANATIKILQNDTELGLFTRFSHLPLSPLIHFIEDK